MFVIDLMRIFSFLLHTAQSKTFPAEHDGHCKAFFQKPTNNYTGTAQTSSDCLCWHLEIINFHFLNTVLPSSLYYKECYYKNYHSFSNTSTFWSMTAVSKERNCHWCFLNYLKQTIRGLGKGKNLNITPKPDISKMNHTH